MKQQEDEKNLMNGRNSGTERLCANTIPRQPSQQEKEEREMTHLPFRSWCRHCVMERGREEDCRKSMEEERQVLEVHLDYMFMGDEEGREDVGSLGCERERDESCAQYGGSEDDDGRMDLPKIDGVEVRQRTGVGKFDCVMEHNEGSDEWMKDDHREQSSWQIEGAMELSRGRSSRCRR